MKMRVLRKEGEIQKKHKQNRTIKEIKQTNPWKVVREIYDLFIWMKNNVLIFIFIFIFIYVAN